jgi:hypothetical protein
MRGALGSLVESKVDRSLFDSMHDEVSVFRTMNLRPQTLPIPLLFFDITESSIVTIMFKLKSISYSSLTAMIM